MSASNSDQLAHRQLREKTPSPQNSEAAAGPVHFDPVLHGVSASVPPLANAELVQLQIRVIALENLLIALLADGSDGQRQFAREMAAYISPRPGCTPHALTLHAATQMVHLVERGALFSAQRSTGSSLG